MPEPPRRLGGLSPAAQLLAFGIALIVAILVLAGVAIWQMRERALLNAEREAANLNYVLAEHTARAVQSVDLVLTSTMEWYASLTPDQEADAQAMHRMLKARIASLPHITVLMIVRADGSVSHSTRSVPPPTVNLADLPYFIEHRERPDAGLLINAPRKSRVDGRWSLYFTRGLYGPGGEFLGMVDALVDPAYFDDFYAKIRLGEGSAVALLRSDGILLTRYPLPEGWLGKSFAGGAAFTQIFTRADHGVVRTPGVLDGVERIVSGHRLTDFPLAVNVTIPLDSALAEWRRQASLVSAGALTAILVLGGSLAVVLAQWRRREKLTGELAGSEARLREAQRIASLGSWVYWVDAGTFEWSEQSLRILGTPAPDAPRDLAGFLERVSEEERRSLDACFRDAQAAARDSGTLEVETCISRAAGDAAWVRLAAHPVHDAEGRLVRIDGTLLDVTRQRAAEERLRLAASVFERSTEANMVVDREGNIVSVNPAFCRITGYSEAEVLGRNPRLLASGRHSAAFYHEMWNALRVNGRWEGEIWNRRKNGEVFPERMSIAAAHDARGDLTHYIAVFSDISERKAAEDRIQNLAYYDPLTSLPNRSLLNDRLDQALARALRAEARVAILFLDLDHFKNINDALGHHAGDSVLQAVAERLRACVREVDTVARHGGDEFIVVLPGTDAQGAARVAQKVIDTLSQPLSVMDREMTSTPSVGVAIFPEDGTDAETLIRNADAAMYHAKASGRGNYQFFTEEMNARAFEALAMESSLRRSLEREELFLVYQPLIDVASGAVVGAEALVRWHHPEMGVVLPDRFIFIAEENGLITPLGEWVLRAACRQHRAWQDAGLPDIVMAVNLSAVQFHHQGFAESLRAILAETGMDARRLELEVTERVIMRNADAVIHTLHELKALGLRLSVDDFGTGYSSLNYLKLFPLDKLKIDKSFVRDILTDPDDVTIIRSIIGLGRDFNLTVIAEGVETPEQLEFLRAAGCHQAQGYCFSRPLPAAEFAALLRRGAPAAEAPPAQRSA